MDRMLLKKIIRRIQPVGKEVAVPGYSSDEIRVAMDELIRNGVISTIKGTKFIPDVENVTIQEGTPFFVKKTGEQVEGYQISESELEKLYKIDRMGNDID